MRKIIRVLPLLFLGVIVSFFILYGNQEGNADTGCISVNDFKEVKLVGFWENLFIELIITKNSWNIYKIDKFKKTRESHEKGRYALFTNRVGNRKDYTVVKLFYDLESIDQDSPVLRMMVDFKNGCLWSKKYNIKVCRE